MRFHTRDTNQAFAIAHVKQAVGPLVASEYFVALILFHNLGLDFVENI
jgi:hypothetical protein